MGEYEPLVITWKVPLPDHPAEIVVHAFQDLPVRIVWITRNGEVIREDTRRIEDMEVAR